MAQGLESARKTSWAGVCLGVVVSCHAAYRQFKLPPILPDLLREHPHHPAIAAGFRSVYALVGLLVSQPLGRWLEGLGFAVCAIIGPAIAARPAVSLD